jgi:hypothetical protein
MFVHLMRSLSCTPCALFAAIFLLACGQSPSTPGATATGAGGTGAGGSTTTSTGGAGGAGPWRSALYPEAWTPALTDAQGRFLHDFSYAGYHHGEADPKAPAAAPVLDVVTKYGADPLGKADATAAAQKALDDAGAMGGAVVFFPEGLYRFDGVLAAHASGVVVRGAGADKTRLYWVQIPLCYRVPHSYMTGSA